ncbi:MAG: hypothetical protein ACXABY_07725 [Candidatus Thorarchaeota archaeon]|jgi:hypothetical protein
MAVKKKKKTKAKVDTKKKSKKKRTDDEDEPRVTRKSFILDSIERAGSKGISVAALVEKTNEEFDYGEGKSSRMRVNNTVKEAAESGDVKVKDGLVTRKK